MTTRHVVIVDNGGANIASLRFALERLAVTSRVSSEAAAIRAASHVILPGVGAAADAMQRLRRDGLSEVIRGLEQPVLGICLGMQLLFDASEEGDADCLGLIGGRATRFTQAPGRPVPHIGWNTLDVKAPNGLLADVQSSAYAYFVHSFALPVGPWTVATTDYGGEFSACVSHRNFHGAQFHPERSASVGAQVLRNFLSLS